MNIFLIIFILLSVFHIGTIIFRKKTLEQVSKPLILPALLAVYIAGGGMSQFWLPVPALILGCIGDILLIKIEKKTNLMLGLLSFLLGHVCYIIIFLQILGFFGSGVSVTINIPSIVIFTPPALVLAIVVFRLVKPSKELYVPVIIYMAVLELLTFFGFQISLFYPGLASLLIVSGCLCFMISDTILAYYTFRKIKMSGTLLLMSYYILAQAEIIMGLLLLR